MRAMKQKLQKERSFQLFMEQDFYFDGQTGRKLKEPISHIYSDKKKLKDIIMQMRKEEASK